MLREGMYVSYFEYDNTGVQQKRIGQWMSEKKDKRTDVKAIIYVAIGILLAFSTYTDLAGVLSVLSRKTMYNICGVIVYIIPIYAKFVNIIRTNY